MSYLIDWENGRVVGKTRDHVPSGEIVIYAFQAIRDDTQEHLIFHLSNPRHAKISNAKKYGKIKLRTPIATRVNIERCGNIRNRVRIISPIPEVSHVLDVVDWCSYEFLIEGEE